MSPASLSFPSLFMSHFYSVLLLIYFLIYNTSVVSSHNLPSFSIGALFNLDKMDGTIDLEGVQTKEAILMAIREINNKSDGLYDDLLPDTQFTLATQHPGIMFSTSTIAANILRGSFNGYGVRACIGPGTNAAIAGDLPYRPALTRPTCFSLFSLPSTHRLGHYLA
jgi:hypothetical protein